MRHFGEIENSAALRIYGAILAATHVWTALFFWDVLSFRSSFGQSLTVYMMPNGHPTCWPEWASCGWSAHASPVVVTALFAGYLTAGAWSAWSYLRPGALWRAHATNAALFVAKFVFLWSSSPLLPNYHYVLIPIALVYFLLPRKIAALQIAIVLTYNAAGLLKLGPEWLSGAALLGPVPDFVPDVLVTLSLRAVVVMELGAVFGLLARSALVRGWAFGFVTVFHLVSIQQVGLFYPLIMFSELAIFPLVWRVETEKIGRALVDLVRPGPAWATVGLLLAFAAAQFYPHLISKDPAITGEARLVALNMLDASPICYSQMIAEYAGNRRIEFSGGYDALSSRTVRTRCEPLRFFNLARRRCRANARNPQFKDLEVSVISKRQTDARFHRIIHIPEFCSRPPSYTLFGHNAWMTWDET